MRPRSAPAHAAPGRVVLDPDLAAVAVLVAAGGVLALLDDAAPAGAPVADAAWRATLGGLIVACAAVAPPLAWVVSAAGAAAVSSEPLLLVVGVLTTLGAALGATRHPDLRSIGALVGVGVGWNAFRFPHDGFTGASTLVAALVVAPLVASAWYLGPLLLARVLSWLAALTALVALGSAAALLVAGLDTRSALNDAKGLVDGAVTAFRDGDEQQARELLGEGIDALRRADDASSTPWLAPSRVVPLLGHHTAALQDLSSHGLEAATAAQAVLDGLDRSSLTIEAGMVDLAAVQALEPAVVAFADASDRARSAFGEARSPWLVGPLDDALVDAAAELDDVSRSARRAADAVALAPAMLGAGGTRQHLVLLATPAELRGSVGLVGNWALVEATDGAMRLAGVGRVEDLNRALAAAPPQLSEPERYLARYGDYSIATEFQDVTLSPDFPDVAAVAAQLFGAAEGVDVSSVMLVDPDAVAALLRLTGPVTVGDRALNAANVRDFLLLGQYAELPDEAERVAFLDQLLQRTFAELLTIDFPDPWDLDEVFAEVVGEDRLMIAAIDPDEQRLLDQLGIAGAFPELSGDLLGVVTQNGGQNKIDSFLRRQITYEADLDPFTGRIEATATVALTNLVTDLDLPDAVVGNNDQGYDLGTNVSLVTVYSPHRLVEATLDGEVAGFQTVRELGVRAYSRLVEIPAGATVVVTLRFDDVLDLSEAYVLDIPVQPAVSADAIDVRVSVPPGARIAGGPRWRSSVATSADIHVELPLTATG